jgi:hypothetical protein
MHKEYRCFEYVLGDYATALTLLCMGQPPRDRAILAKKEDGFNVCICVHPLEQGPLKCIQTRALKVAFFFFPINLAVDLQI